MIELIAWFVAALILTGFMAIVAVVVFCLFVFLARDEDD